jgi:hypothetical protein
MFPLLGEGPARSMPLRAFGPDPVVRKTRAGKCFVTRGPLGRVGQEKLTMDVKESYTELGDETSR